MLGSWLQLRHMHAPQGLGTRHYHSQRTALVHANHAFAGIADRPI